MDEPSPTARDVLAAYRRRRALDDDAHERVQTRLAASITAHEGAVHRESRRRIVIASVVALATAAAIVMLVRGLRSEQTRFGDLDDRGQAPYEHTTDERSLPIDDREHARASDDAATAHTASPAGAPLSPAFAQPPSSDVGAPEHRESPRNSAAPTPTPDEASLAEELALVRSVRASLDRDDTDAALASIAAHERRFGSGQLVEERKSLRIEALCRTGKGPQARAEAATFLREHASSAHADRVRSTCPNR